MNDAEKAALNLPPEIRETCLEGLHEFTAAQLRKGQVPPDGPSFVAGFGVGYVRGCARPEHEVCTMFEEHYESRKREGT